MPGVSVERPRPAALKVTPVIASLEVPVSSKVRFRVSPFKQVDAVERRILRGGVDLLQHVVVLRDQAGAGGLRVRIGDRSRTAGGQAGERCTGCVGGAVIVPIVDEAALLLVVM